MKDQYIVLFQTGWSQKQNKYLNGGMCYGMDRYFDTLEEAEKCKNYIIEKEKTSNGTISVNGIGISIEYPKGEEDNYKIKKIVIKKRQVTEWEEI